MPTAEIFSGVGFTRYETSRAKHDRHVFAVRNLVHEAALEQKVALDTLSGDEPWIQKIVTDYKSQHSEANFSAAELKRRLVEASAP